MQNIVSIFGGPGAARYLELVASPYRQPTWSLVALNEDGTTLLDISPYLMHAEPGHTDETVSDVASFTIANPGGIFDKFGEGIYSQVLIEKRLIRYRKGLIDPETGDSYLLPAHYGRITVATAEYNPKGEPTFAISVADTLRNPVKTKLTSPSYHNTQVNLIAADLLKRFKFTDDQLALTAVDATYAFVQFTDLPLVDALKTLYDPLLFYVRADEAGRIATGPRLGSDLSALSGLLGYPDQVTEPDPDAVAYTIPDTCLVSTLRSEWQDYDGVSNQVRVYGQEVTSTQSLGPSQLLYQKTPASIDSKGRDVKQYAFQEQPGQNSLIATNVIVQFLYSTNNHLSGTPRQILLSELNWRGAWSATAFYSTGEAVSYLGHNYACRQAASGANLPIDPKYWEAIPFAGPFIRSTDITNEDPRSVGYVKLDAVSPGSIVLRIEGRQYSVGNPYPRRYGGFEYKFNIFGSPVLSANRTIVAYADYNPTTVTAEALSDPFSDHRTWQAEHAPFALSVPVEVFIDGDSQGKITADQTILTGEPRFSVDFERGRIVLKDLVYQNWSPDQDGTSIDHPYSTGGGASSTGLSFDVSQLSAPVPMDVLQSYRTAAPHFGGGHTGGDDFSYTFTGLVVGQGYDIRLTFADPTSTGEKQRVFSVYAQGTKAIEGLDIFAKSGGPRIAHNETLTGVLPDSDGKIVICVTQFDPFSGDLLKECSHDGNGGGGPIGTALLSAIEVLLPQGQGASPYAVNCGGIAINPTPPVVTADYAYSAVQEIEGAQTLEINSPYIATYTDCQKIAGFWVNFLAWKRNRLSVQTASIPHLQPGDLLRWYNPKLTVDFWGYIQSIKRATELGGGDTDTYTTYLLYARKRT